MAADAGDPACVICKQSRCQERRYTCERLVCADYVPEVGRSVAWQAALDGHPVSLRDGRCITCGTEGGCVEREEATRLFARYGVLPRRCPGATRPELAGARRLTTLPQPPGLTESSGLHR